MTYQVGSYKATSKDLTYVNQLTKHYILNCDKIFCFFFLIDTIQTAVYVQYDNQFKGK